MMFQKQLSVGVLVCLLWAGCGGAPDKHAAARKPTVNASGVVKHNGKPVEGATIVLEPVGDAGIAASAVSDSDGSFSLSAYPGVDGAVAGSYKVLITKVEAGDNVIVTDDTHDEAPKKPNKPASLIPAKYSKSATSGLTADIPAAGTDSLAFDLKD